MHNNPFKNRHRVYSLESRLFAYVTCAIIFIFVGSTIFLARYLTKDQTPPQKLRVKLSQHKFIKNDSKVIIIESNVNDYRYDKVEFLCDLITKNGEINTLGDHKLHMRVSQCDELAKVFNYYYQKQREHRARRTKLEILNAIIDRKERRFILTSQPRYM